MNHRKFLAVPSDIKAMYGIKGVKSFLSNHEVVSNEATMGLIAKLLFSITAFSDERLRIDYVSLAEQHFL